MEMTDAFYVIGWALAVILWIGVPVVIMGAFMAIRQMWKELRRGY